MDWQPSKPLWERQLKAVFEKIHGLKPVKKKPGSAARGHRGKLKMPHKKSGAKSRGVKGGRRVRRAG